jgi:dipeptidyl aminopeptidase/acylaminoacyl peptidase
MFPPSVVLKSTFAKPHPLKRPAKFAVKPPELFSFKNTKGETLYGCYFTPRNFDPTKKYPTILKVYGGPHVQLVSNDYSLTHFMVCHLYAHLGYAQSTYVQSQSY